jgi:hypothetical protein
VHRRGSYSWEKARARERNPAGEEQAGRHTSRGWEGSRVGGHGARVSRPCAFSSTKNGVDTAVVVRLPMSAVRRDESPMQDTDETAKRWEESLRCG